MIAKEVVRILLSRLKFHVSSLIQQGKSRSRLIAAQPTLANSFGYNTAIDDSTTIGSQCIISSNVSISESRIGRSVTLAKDVFIRKCTLNDYVSIGNSAYLDFSTIDSYSYLGRNCWITDTSIGKFCSIAQKLSCGTGNHPTHMLSTSPAFYLKHPVCGISFSPNYAYDGHPATKIGHDVWIGADVFIKSGIQVGNGAIIAAGAVVMKDVSAYSIVGGVPAREIRKRYSEEDISVLESLQWWDLPENKLREIATFIQAGDLKALREWKAIYEKSESPLSETSA